MRRKGRRWSTNVYVRPGALGGWHDNETTRERRRSLARAAKRDGAGEVSRRLNFIANVGSRSNNSRLRRVAREDQRWVAATLEDEDGRGRRSKPVRVRSSQRARHHRRSKARR